MNKFYLVAPLAALVVFALFQRHHARDFAAREAEQNRLTLAARAEEERASQAARDAARDAAIAAQEQRRLASEEKKRIAETERQARLDALERLEAAKTNEVTLKRQLAALRDERAETERLLAVDREKVRVLELEKADNERTIAYAESMRAALHRVRDEIEAADARRQRTAALPSPATNR